MKNISQKISKLEENSLEYVSSQERLFKEILNEMNINKFDLIDSYFLNSKEIYSERKLYTVNEYTEINLNYYEFEKLNKQNIEEVFLFCCGNQKNINFSEHLINHDYNELNNLKDFSKFSEYEVFIGILCCTIKCHPQVFYDFLNFILNDYPKSSIPSKYITSREGDFG